MTADLPTLKAAVDFRQLVLETRELDRNAKAICPFHDDHNPSCHIYPDGFRCYVCGARGDHLDWLQAVGSLTTAAAIRELERRAGDLSSSSAPRQLAKTTRPAVAFKPVTANVLERHRRQAEKLASPPIAVQQRGFESDDLKILGFAAHRDNDAVFPITSPDGAVLALKVRSAQLGGGDRYRYTTRGCGTPAWCSPGFLEHDQVLVIEGELNGMAAWLAAPELGVMAVAGTNGALHLEALKGRTVYVYADADDTGQKARDRWAAQALEAGATKVYTLAPWPADACDLAGKEGRPALRERLTLSMAEARPVEPEGKPAAPESEPDEKEPRRSQASELYDLVKTSGAELFHTPDDEPHITITVDGHLETYRLKSKGARAWLRHLYRAETGKTIGGQALQDALNDLEGVALFDGREHGVFVRLAWDADDVVLDLGDSSHRVVRVNRTGYRIETISPVKFVRPKALAALPVPEAGGSISELWELLNISDDDRPLVTGWLVAALRPSGPYPILALHGEQGSAKSTTARALRALVDPSTAPLRSEPRDARDLMIAATSSWAPAFDNISSISPALSDALCILSTGGGFASRALYTDDEEVILTAQRPVILTGIADVATRPDLLDRCLVLYLPRIKDGERRPESTFWRAFGEAHGRILGALLTAVSAGLRGVDTVKLAELPRMADFAIWAVACEESTVPKVDGFITRYGANRAAANELALDATPLPQVLRELVEGQPERTWQGNATELLAALNLLLQNRQDDRTPKLKEWPKRADKLSGAVRRYAPNLRATGLEVDFTQETTGQKRKLIILRRVGQTSETSETSETELDDDREGREKGGFASSFANDASFATSETGQSSETRSETGEITSSTAQTPAGFASSASFAKKSSCSKRWEIEL